MYTYYSLYNKSKKLFSGFDGKVIPIDENGKFKSSMFLKVCHLNSNQLYYTTDIRELLALKEQFIDYIERNKRIYDSRMPGLSEKMKRVVAELKPCLPCVDNIIPVDNFGNPI